jgi:hypothetical protein
MGEVIAAHAVMFLEMADDGLNGGTPFELALDLRREAGLLAARVGLELVFGRSVVAAIASIGDTTLEHVADERLHLRNDRGERVPVIRIAGQRCGMGDELAARHGPSARKDSPYRSGRSPDWLKSKNPACAAVKREAEEDWGRSRSRLF